MTGMTLYRIKPGFDPVTAPHPGWSFGGGMDYLLTSVFEIQGESAWSNFLVTVDHHGHSWYLHPEWVVPAVSEIDLTVLGDEV